MIPGFVFEIFEGNIYPRDGCVSYQEYVELIERCLKGTLALDLNRGHGDFWSQGWLARKGPQGKVILLEHEIGLKILAVGGSVASLIALFPMISSG